jgi:histidine triad (HIT) family protein
LIAERRSPAQFVDEDERTLAFMDINPWRRGHALMIPRRHARDLFEIEPEDLAMVFATAKLAGNRHAGLRAKSCHFAGSFT